MAPHYSHSWLIIRLEMTAMLVLDPPPILQPSLVKPSSELYQSCCLISSSKFCFLIFSHIRRSRDKYFKSSILSQKSVSGPDSVETKRIFILILATHACQYQHFIPHRWQAGWQLLDMVYCYHQYPVITITPRTPLDGFHTMVTIVTMVTSYISTTIAMYSWSL